MGRNSYSSRLFADGLKKLEISWLNKNNYLNLGRYGGFNHGGIKWTDKWSMQESEIGFYISTYEDNMYITLVYAILDSYGAKKRFHYKVNLTTTECNLGGKRFWFLCPLIMRGMYCGNRVGKLYLVGKYFGCRHCHNLTYRSRNENTGSNSYFFGKYWQREEKIDQLWMSLKRSFYAAKLTKQQRKLWLLTGRF